MSGGNFQATPVVRSLNQIADRAAKRFIQLTGKSLPASLVSINGSIATVKIELTGIGWIIPQITVPLAGSEFVRLPLQAGTKGWVKSADSSLGAMSGLGAATTGYVQPANLQACVFEPIGNVAFAAPEDPNQLELYGNDGLLVKSTVNKEWYARWTTSGVTISNKAGTASMAWNGSAWLFTGPVIFSGLVTMQSALQLAGNIESATGGTYGGNISTSGGITAGAGGADMVTLQGHIHTVSGGGTSTPTPGH
jgi:hypothetical protein